MRYRIISLCDLIKNKALQFFYFVISLKQNKKDGESIEKGIDIFW